MTSQEAVYRLKVAKGFLDEGREDLRLGRWRSAVDNAQLAAFMLPTFSTSQLLNL